MAKHDSFLIKHDVRPLIDNLTDEQAGQLLKALMIYSADEESSTFDEPLLSATYAMMTGHIAEHNRRYQETCERNRENGRRGGEATQSNRMEKEATATEAERAIPTASNGKRKKATATERVANQADRIGLDGTGLDRTGLVTDSVELADVAAIILADGSEWRPTKAMFDSFVQAFPGVDVKAEFAKMRAWSEANPKNRKTWAGASRFANSWLSREQDRPRPRQQAEQQERKIGGFKVSDIERLVVNR